jgi:rRNA maturation protein Nop10
MSAKKKSKRVAKKHDMRVFQLRKCPHCGKNVRIINNELIPTGKK